MTYYTFAQNRVLDGIEDLFKEFPDLDVFKSRIESRSNRFIVSISSHGDNSTTGITFLSKLTDREKKEFGECMERLYHCDHMIELRKHEFDMERIYLTGMSFAHDDLARWKKESAELPALVVRLLTAHLKMDPEDLVNHTSFQLIEDCIGEPLRGIVVKRIDSQKSEITAIKQPVDVDVSGVDDMLSKILADHSASRG